MMHPLEMQYGPVDGWIILLLMGGLSISFFIYQVVKATRLVMLGAPDNRFDSVALLDIVKVIEQEKEKFIPDVVFTHHGGDLNIDHLVLSGDRNFSSKVLAAEHIF